MRNKGQEEDCSKTRSLLFQILKNNSTSEELSDWFSELTKQLWKSKMCECNSRSMKELIRLSSEVGVDFKYIMGKHNKFGNTLLMKLAMRMRDEAMREILTNKYTSKYVSEEYLLVPTKYIRN